MPVYKKGRKGNEDVGRCLSPCESHTLELNAKMQHAISHLHSLLAPLVNHFKMDRTTAGTSTWGSPANLTEPPPTVLWLKLVISVTGNVYICLPLLPRSLSFTMCGLNYKDFTQKWLMSRECTSVSLVFFQLYYCLSITLTLHLSQCILFFPGHVCLFLKTAFSSGFGVPHRMLQQLPPYSTSWQTVAAQIQFSFARPSHQKKKKPSQASDPGPKRDAVGRHWGGQ